MRQFQIKLVSHHYFSLYWWHNYRLGYSIVRFEAVSSLDGLQTVRKHLQTIQILQRLLKSMQKPSLTLSGPTSGDFSQIQSKIHASDKYILRFISVRSMSGPERVNYPSILIAAKETCCYKCTLMQYNERNFYLQISSSLAMSKILFCWFLCIMYLLC